METPLQEWSSDLLRLGAAALVGAVLGLDRERSGKPLGLRTLTVVAIASCALTVAALRHDLAGGGDETVGRVVQGLMAGIGFLGGGVILQTQQRHIHGLTTAALVWLTASLGVVCGLGNGPVVIAAMSLALLILVIAPPIERRLQARRTPTGADDAS